MELSSINRINYRLFYIYESKLWQALKPSAINSIDHILMKMSKIPTPTRLMYLKQPL